MNSSRTVLTTRDSQKRTYTCSRTIFVSRFLRFWWKFSGKRARIASAEDRSRKATSLVKRCRAWSNCRTKRAEAQGTHKGQGWSSAHSPQTHHQSHGELTQVWGLCSKR